MDSSPGFASAACDSIALFRLAFATARCPLTSPHTATRRLILQKARGHRCQGGSRCLWAHGFRRCFTPLSGCFSPFPRGTSSLSVIGECSALEGGPPCFGPGFTCPALLWIGNRESSRFAYGALTRCGRPSHAVPLARRFVTPAAAWGPRASRPTTPDGQRPQPWAPHPVWARALSLAATRAISVDFSSSGYLDVSVPPVVPPRGGPRGVAAHDGGWVHPFGNPGIEGRLRLPRAYRGLPRPSSTSDAKASAVRP